MTDPSKESPAAQLMDSVDFRINSIQELLIGNLTPLERRSEIVDRRRDALLSGHPLNADVDSGASHESSEYHTNEDEITSTDKRASRTGTASHRDIDQSAPKVGASRPETEQTDDTETNPTTEPSSTPSMAEAAGIKMGTRIDE